eukprot:9436017-Pyramimonas_sp.AAC.1
MAPCGLQDASRTANTAQDGLQDGPKTPPRRPQDGPRVPPDGPRGPQDAPSGLQEDLREAKIMLL